MDENYFSEILHAFLRFCSYVGYAASYICSLLSYVAFYIFMLLLNNKAV